MQGYPGEFNNYGNGYPQGGGMGYGGNNFNPVYQNMNGQFMGRRGGFWERRRERREERRERRGGRHGGVYNPMNGNNGYYNMGGGGFGGNPGFNGGNGQFMGNWDPYYQGTNNYNYYYPQRNAVMGEVVQEGDRREYGRGSMNYQQQNRGNGFINEMAPMV